jgi:multiple sugar transport system permease protein
MKKMQTSRPRGLRRFFDVSTLTFRLWDFTGTAILNFFIWVVILLYLSPLTYMVATSLKTNAQLSDGTSPIYPATAIKFSYQGTEYDVYDVPTDHGTMQLALMHTFPKYSEFIDPANPGAGIIRWDGWWRSLHRAYHPSITFSNFVNLWKNIDYPNLLRNTLIVVGLGELGMFLSSIAVAYGFSRFRIPGGKWIFLLLIATIMIPDSITLVPSYVIYARVLGWNGSFLPLVVPHFFGNAIYIFLLRQNFKTIPRDMDEAAMMDGAGPLRILISIILPQAVPVVVTVGLLQFFNAWNEMRMSSLFLSIRPDLQTMAFSAQAFVSIGFTPEVLQASAIVLMIIPVIVLFLAQRYFMQDMVVTGMEK